MSEPGHDLEYFERTPIVHIVTMSDAGHEVVTPIWAVVAHGHAYIRNGHGPGCKWFGRVVRAHAAEFADGERRIPASAEPILDPDALDRVDDAYRAKYGHQPEPLALMLAADARGDTLLITPQQPRHPATGSIDHV
ncbi:MAG: hypothetical protein BGO95_10940 [Micrococcales bacterium 73-13]|mgnify:CR=1 FL=1|nr:MAG: hypothetical protein BGO95_10940 [Micrococcales bacterium 73-13]